MDLSTLNIYLTNLDGPLPIHAVRGHALNGSFYGELDRHYHRWVSRLHHLDRSETLPFSISPLVEDGQFIGMRVGALNREAGVRIREVWENLQSTQATIRVGSASMLVSQVESGKPWPASYDKVWDTAPIKFGICLAFETPFRLTTSVVLPNDGRSRSHYSLLPTPKGLWQWCARRWNIFSSIPLPPGFIDWVDRQVCVMEVHLDTTCTLIEQNIEWKGAVGEVAYQAFGDSRDVPESRLPDYLRAFQALAMLAEYSGAGEKTGWGMGRVRRVRTFSPFRGEHGTAGSGEGE